MISFKGRIMYLKLSSFFDTKKLTSNTNKQMKKFFFLLIVTIVLVACNGCGDINPPEPPAPPVIQKFTVVGIAGPNGTITPARVIVEKGKSASFTMQANEGYLIESLKDNGATLAPISFYTISNVSKNTTHEVTFKKDSLLWPLLNITWKQVGLFSLKEGEEWVEWDNPYPKVMNFASDGKVLFSWDGKTYLDDWSLDKTKSPAILIRSGNHWTIETLTEKNMSIYYTNSQGIVYKETYVAK
jgi:hypothetical protein